MFSTYSRISGFLHGEPIYEDELTSDILCNDYFVVYRGDTPSFLPFNRQVRCGYCGRHSEGEECKGCGAPMKVRK